MLVDILTHEGILRGVIALLKLKIQQKVKTSGKPYPDSGFPQAYPPLPPPDKIQNAQGQLSGGSFLGPLRERQGATFMPGSAPSSCITVAKMSQLFLTPHLHLPAPPFPVPWVPLPPGRFPPTYNHAETFPRFSVGLWHNYVPTLLLLVCYKGNGLNLLFCLTSLLAPSLKPCTPTCGSSSLPQPSAPADPLLQFPGSAWLPASLPPTWTITLPSGPHAGHLLLSPTQAPPQQTRLPQVLCHSFMFLKPLMRPKPLTW